MNAGCLLITGQVNQNDLWCLMWLVLLTVRVDVDYACGSASTPICEMAGVELSIAPSRPPNGQRVVTQQVWIPYGERVSTDAKRAAYSRQLLAFLKTRVLPELLSQQDDLSVKLQQVGFLLHVSALYQLYPI